MRRGRQRHDLVARAAPLQRVVPVDVEVLRLGRFSVSHGRKTTGAPNSSPDPRTWPARRPTSSPTDRRRTPAVHLPDGREMWSNGTGDDRAGRLARRRVLRAAAWDRGASDRERYIMKRLALAAALAALTVPAAASAATVPVGSLSAPFGATNVTVVETGDGVHFGPYGNGGTAGGSLFYSGANGLKLSQITQLALHREPQLERRQPDRGAVPADLPQQRRRRRDLRRDQVRRPSSRPRTRRTTSTSRAVMSATTTTGATACPPEPAAWADVVAAHGNDVVSGHLRDHRLHGRRGPRRPRQPTSRSTAPRSASTVGAHAAGASGAPGTTTIVRVPVPVNARPVGTAAARSRSCKGDELRVIHARRRGSERLLGVRATLRGGASASAAGRSRSTCASAPRATTTSGSRAGSGPAPDTSARCGRRAR